MATDDGSEGYHGLVTDVLKEKVKDFDYVYTCGPEKCIEGVLDICLENRVPLQASLERYMKCGLGVCGSCMLGPWRVCADGPVFTDEQLKKLREEFGKFRRAPSGLKEAL
jgi:dihydroorotate dehydrogenase electron transfer subunit